MPFQAIVLQSGLLITIDTTIINILVLYIMCTRALLLVLHSIKSFFFIYIFNPCQYSLSDALLF
ncbi:hypothetical protein CLU79DRAFT_751148 [Phycomyces nitens]|nr:hypothetical protein CLU79DRAFT_751148 [Phycomyces nitens]